MGLGLAALTETLAACNASLSEGVLHVNVEGPMWIARVTPVVHYTMGGLRVGPDAAVMGVDGAPLPRLWAAGEVTGGLHGRNRLGGNSLAECTVFGRIAGSAAAKTILAFPLSPAVEHACL